MILEELETIEIPPPDELRGRLVIAARQVRILRGLLKLSARDHPSEGSKSRSPAGADASPQRRESACV
jgi:hypothetical protein